MKEAAGKDNLFTAMVSIPAKAERAG